MDVSRWFAVGFPAAFGLALSVLPALADSNCETSANFGSILSLNDISSAVKALPPQALLGKKGKPVEAPPKRSFLTNLPAVAQQGSANDPGSPGTCEAQSYGYGLGSYTAARASNAAIKWDASVPQNSASAAWLYALVQQRAGRQCPDGSRSIDYLEQLAGAGAPSRAQVPYQSNCTYLNWVSTAPRPSMQRFLIGSYAVIPVTGNAGAVAQIKSHVQYGQAVAFTGSVLCGYALHPGFSHGVIYDTATVPNSGHGQLIVGYDDRIGRDKQPGALLVQNSFGTNWPPSTAGSAAPAGQAYWSYNTFSATQLMAAVAYPAAESLGKWRLDNSVINATAGSVVRSYQWTPRTSDTSVYLIVDLAFAGPVKLNEVWLTEPGGAKLQVRAVYGQHLSSGYAYLKRTDGKSFLSGDYKLTLKTGEPGGVAVTYTGKIKVKKLKKAGALTPASMQGVSITGPTGAPVTTN